MGKFLKSAATVITGVALAASVTAVADQPAQAASGCSASFSTYTTVRQGSTGSQAKAVECLLHRAGYGTTVNGSVSAHDAAQLARFRSSVGLSPLESAGPRGWSALLSSGSRPVLRTGSTGSDVQRLQRTLRALRYTSVGVTGYYGSATTSAVKKVQKDRHLAQTGRTSAALWRALQHGTASPAAAAAPKAKAKAAKVVSARSTSKGARAVAFARRQLGEPYRFGAAGPSAWDCSGLTRGAWRSVGVSLPHSAKQQYGRGRAVSKSNLRPGDLVFYYSGPHHVAIYAGGGKVIHAPRPGRSVSYASVSSMPFKGARRIG